MNQRKVLLRNVNKRKEKVMRSSDLIEN